MPARGAQDARRLLRTGLFTPWYYEAQAGRRFDSPVLAAADFLAKGAARGLLANPLTDFVGSGRDASGVRADLLSGDARLYPLRPLFDDVAYVRRVPAAADHPGGPAGHLLEAAEAGGFTPNVEGVAWDAFVRRRKRQGRAIKPIRRSHLFDVDYYRAQCARELAGPLAAVWHFLEVGEAQGLSPHPLYEPGWFRTTSAINHPVLFARFLTDQQVTGAAGPHFDGALHLADHPEAAEHRGGPLGHFMETSTPETPTPASAGVDPAPVGLVVDLAREVAAVHGRQQRAAGLAPRRTWPRWLLDREASAETTPGGPSTQRVSVLADARRWFATDTAAAERTVLGQTHDRWLLRLAVEDLATAPDHLRELAGGEPRIELVEVGPGPRAHAHNRLVATSDDPFVAFWHPREVWAPTVLARLLAAVGDADGAHGASVQDGTDPVWSFDLPDDEDLLWSVPRSLSGFLLRTERLRAAGDPFRPEAGDHWSWDLLVRLRPRLEFVPFVAAHGRVLPANTTADLPPGQRSSDEHVVRAEQLLDWDALTASLPSRVAGRVSALVPTYRDWSYTLPAVRAALASSHPDVEVVVVDNGSDREVCAVLRTCFAGDPRVVVRRLPRNTNFSTGSNVAFAESTGAQVVFLNNDTEVGPGWLEPLVARLAEPDVLGAQPLLVYDDHSVQTAGTVFLSENAIPTHFLASHPREDLPDVSHLRFAAVTAACMALDASTVASLHGFDPVFANGMEDVDLCLRARRDLGGHFVTEPASLVVHHESKTPGRFTSSESNRLRFLDRWHEQMPPVDHALYAEAGFELTGVRAFASHAASRRRTAAQPLLVRHPRTVAEGPGAGLPSLRWAVKISAWGGIRGDHWGDVFFADDLARGLRAFGQEVVVDRAGAHERPDSDYLDDVALTLRGRVPTAPQPGATNVLWVISHPDLVGDVELRSGFDLVYSAGRGWAEHATQTSGRTVRTLLQATDTTRFRPDGPRVEGHDVLFVGRTREVFRPIVRDAVEVGADLAIYGDGWEVYLPDHHVRAQILDNAAVPQAYRGARIVLNDHWEDMARWGFFSNRLFDAAASGARVVSDPVPGMAEAFGPSVREYRTPDELRTLLDPSGDAWASDAEIAANAASMAERHSFENRARTLLADVLDARGVEHDLR